MSDTAADWALVRRYVEWHDDAAFTALVEKHRPFVRALITRELWRGRCEALADTVDDVEQQVWCRLWEWMGRLTPEGHVLVGWLGAVATNLSKNVLRNQHRRRRAVTRDETEDGSWLGGAMDERTDYQPDTYPVRRETVEAVAYALDRLPAAFRAVVLLRADGFAYEAIACALGISVGTVKSRLSRGRAMARAAMQEVT